MAMTRGGALMAASSVVLASHTIYRWGPINTYRDQLLRGLMSALDVAVTSLVLADIFGMLLAMWRMAPRWYSWPAAFYINIFRRVPPLVSVIWVYFGLALALNIQFSFFEASVVALVPLYSAFLAGHTDDRREIENSELVIATGVAARTLAGPECAGPHDRYFGRRVSAARGTDPDSPSRRGRGWVYRSRIRISGS
ncbi:MAG: ABC transporter permease subunit [Actinomycetota bacterium]|nr:ABC transporter permease subunit [Actinomycetota bacterium]